MSSRDPTEPPPDYSYGLLIAGHAAVVVVGIVLAMRRESGPWRSLLLAGLAATGFMHFLWWFSSQLDLGTWITSPSVSLAYVWARVFVQIAELVGLGAVAAGAVLGRPPRAVAENPGAAPG